jgi:hypothetical protein
MMQRKTKIFTAGGLAALVALGGVAGFAYADRGGHGGWHGEGHGGKGRGMMGQEMMERYDANKDGKLTQAEIDQNRTQWYGDFDADKNGGLTLQEFTNLWLKARNEMIVREFQFFDRDGNGSLTIAEYQAPMQNMVATRDRNGDGVLSQDDRRMRLRHHDGDGPGKGRGMMDDDDGPKAGSQPEGGANP